MVTEVYMTQGFWLAIVTMLRAQSTEACGMISYYITNGAK